MKMSSMAALRHGIFKELIPPDIEQRLLPLEELKRLPTGTVLGEGYDLFGDASYLAVPLPGHAFGHFGISGTTRPARSTQPMPRGRVRR